MGCTSIALMEHAYIPYFGVCYSGGMKLWLNSSVLGLRP